MKPKPPGVFIFNEVPGMCAGMPPPINVPTRSEEIAMAIAVLEDPNADPVEKEVAKQVLKILGDPGPGVSINTCIRDRFIDCWHEKCVAAKKHGTHFGCPFYIYVKELEDQFPIIPVETTLLDRIPIPLDEWGKKL